MGDEMTDLEHAQAFVAQRQALDAQRAAAPQRSHTVTPAAPVPQSDAMTLANPLGALPPVVPAPAGSPQADAQAIAARPDLMARIGAAAPQAPVGRPGTAPSLRRVTNTTTTTKGIEGADEMRERGAEILEDQQRLAQDAAMLQIEQADIRKDALVNEQIATDRAAAEVAGIRAQGAEEAAGHMAQAQELRGQAKELQQQGHDFWGEKNAGFKIIAMLGSIFGGALQGLQGGKNQFLEHIDGLIAREDKAHQDKIDGLREDAAGEVTFYDIARTRTDDAVAQRMIAHGMMLDSVKLKMQSQMEGLGDSQAALDMGEAYAELEQASLANDAKFADHTQTTAAQKMVKVPGRAPTGDYATGAGLGPDGKPLKTIPGTRIDDHQAYAGLSTTDRSEARKVSGSANALFNSLDEMAKIRREFGTESGDTSAQSRYTNLAQSAKVSLSQMMDQGTITAADAEQMKDLWEEDLKPRLSDVQRVAGVDPTLNKLEGAMDNVERQANNRLRAYGLNLEGLKSTQTRVEGLESGVR